MLTFWGVLACSGSRQVVVPTDMPDICREIDFSRADESLKQECGVQTRNYRAYRNIPQHRNLLLPKNGQIVLKGDDVELRLEGFLPIDLPHSIREGVEFNEKLRRQFIKSKYDYLEYFTAGADRPDRIFKLDLPLTNGKYGSVCFFVERGKPSSQRKTGYASRLLDLDCAEFEKRKAEFAAPVSLDESGQETFKPEP